MDRERIRASVPTEIDGDDPTRSKGQAEAFIAAVLDELEREGREPDAWEALDLAYALTLIEGGIPLAAIHYGRRAITPVAERGDELWRKIGDFPSAVQLAGWLAQVRAMPVGS
jgi:hypothetical protein